MRPWHDVRFAMSEGSLQQATKGLGIDNSLPFGLKIWEFKILSNLDALVSPILYIYISKSPKIEFTLFY